MPWNLLLLPLLGGYYYCTRAYSAKYRYRRADGNRLLLAASLHGILFLFIASVFAFFATPYIDSSLPTVSAWWHTNVQFAHSGKAFLALVTAFAATHLRNAGLLPVPKFRRLRKALGAEDRDKAIKKDVIADEGDVLEQLIGVAFERQQPMLLTLKTGKVYLAFTMDGFQPALDRKYLALFPVWSGYRSKDTQEVVFTSDYRGLYARLEAENPALLNEMRLAVPVDQILTATLFDKRLYDEQFAKKPPEFLPPSQKYTEDPPPAGSTTP